MSMRTLQTGFVLIVLALLSQGVAAAMMPCDLSAQPGSGTDFTESAEQACHDDAPAHSTGMNPDQESGHDCAQQCACPAGLNYPVSGALLGDFAEADLQQHKLTEPANRLLDLLFRPPILG